MRMTESKNVQVTN